MSSMPVPWGLTGLVSLSPWPPANGLTTINCPRNVTVFSIYASTQIDAPANIIWNTLRNTTAFPEWNTFTPKVTITSQAQSEHLPADEQGFFNLGTKFTDEVVLNPSAPGNLTLSYEQVSDFSTPKHPSTYVPNSILKSDGSFYPDLEKIHRIAWITDPDSAIVKAGLFTERFNEIIPLDESGGRKKGCEYRTWENQGGPPAIQIKALYQSLLQEDFEIWARDLKKESERKVTIHDSNHGHGNGND